MKIKPLLLCLIAANLLACSATPAPTVTAPAPSVTAPPGQPVHLTIQSGVTQGRTSQDQIALSGTAPAGRLIIVMRYRATIAAISIRDEVAQVQADAQGSWRVSGVKLSCGLNSFEAEDERSSTESSPITVLYTPPAAGPYLTSTPTSGQAATFTSQQKVVATHYFYWYDATNGDFSEPRIHHEPNETRTSFTWRNPDWHTKHLLDMIRAQIDIMLPVYWGVPCEAGLAEHSAWSDGGLRVLTSAWAALAKTGATPSKIGMFYDTSSLGVGSSFFDSAPPNVIFPAKLDLTDPNAMERFYLPIRNFYSIVPPEQRATIDGRPVVWLYDTAQVSNYNAETFLYVKRRFVQDFGGAEPYIVREMSWNQGMLFHDGKPVVDNAYRWGNSLYGYYRVQGVAEIGPGYDESALPSRHVCASEDTQLVGCPRKRGRANGAWYVSQWQMAIADRANVNIAAIEVWNEYFEGNAIAETVEYGRQYIDLTAIWAKRFKQGS